MKLDGTVQTDEEGVICNDCGDVIEKGEKCIRVDHGEIVDGHDSPRAVSVNRGGVYHRDCI